MVKNRKKPTKNHEKLEKTGGLEGFGTLGREFLVGDPPKHTQTTQLAELSQETIELQRVINKNTTIEPKFPYR